MLTTVLLVELRVWNVWRFGADVVDGCKGLLVSIPHVGLARNVRKEVEH